MLLMSYPLIFTSRLRQIYKPICGNLNALVCKQSRPTNPSSMEHNNTLDTFIVSRFLLQAIFHYSPYPGMPSEREIVDVHHFFLPSCVISSGLHLSEGVVRVGSFLSQINNSYAGLRIAIIHPTYMPPLKPAPSISKTTSLLGATKSTSSWCAIPQKSLEKTPHPFINIDSVCVNQMLRQENGMLGKTQGVKGLFRSSRAKINTEQNEGPSAAFCVGFETHCGTSSSWSLGINNHFGKILHLDVQDAWRCPKETQRSMPSLYGADSPDAMERQDRFSMFWKSPPPKE